MDGKILVFVPNETLPLAIETARQLCAQCVERGAQVFAVTEVAAETLGVTLFDFANARAVDLVIALGGDGTILRASHLMENHRAPLIGVKFGKLGFLTGATASNGFEAIQKALSGSAYIESRETVEVSGVVDGREVKFGSALNEAVIGRGFDQPVITTMLRINGHSLYTSSGDGLIVATATGSTAYALSAGGPIMSPDFDGLVIVPLASHTLVQRAVVTGRDDTVVIDMPDERRSNIELTLDGTLVPVNGRVSSIRCKISDHTVELVKLDNRLFYDTVAAEFFSGQQ